MKVIGIEIKKAKAFFYALESGTSGKMKNLTGDFRFLALEDDTDNRSVRSFQSKVHAFFNAIHPDYIAILKRQTKGRFRSAPLSFKIEGLIQCYKKIDIEFVQPMAVSAYFKKNEFNLELENEDQEPAAKLAYFLCFRE